MREDCHCRMEAMENLEPVMASDFRGALRCPGCGNLDYMEDLPNEVRFAAWSEAKRSRGMRHVHPPRRSRHRGVRFAPGGVAFVEGGPRMRRSKGARNGSLDLRGE